VGWRSFQRQDFLRLKTEFGVTGWFCRCGVDGLSCPYKNSQVMVCRVE